MSEQTPADDHQGTGQANAVLGLHGARTLVLLPIFLLLLFAIYWPALEGPFFSDDFSNIAHNDYIHELSWANTMALLDPKAAPATFTQNYAPVHMFAHALEWRVFGDQVAGYHAVNLLLHAIVSTLLVTLLIRSGIRPLGATLGGAFFLLHPANVEAVAWIYQLKTTLALLLVLAALLLRDRKAGAAFAMFVLALLTKALAAVALPVAVLEAWCRRDREPASTWGGLVAWSAAVALLAYYGFGAFDSTNAPVPRLDPDPLVEARTIVSIAGRYLVMAATGYGVSAFQEAPIAKSAFDPWWLCSLAAILAIGTRAVLMLLRRRQEAVYWGWAAAAFLPISQLFPFIHPIADRYLYLILPGLIGAVLLAGRGLADRRSVAIALTALAVLALGTFGLRSHQRALLWRQPLLLEQHAIERFPDGLLANNYRADLAAARGDIDTALIALRKRVDRGDIRFRPLMSQPIWRQHHGDPRLQEIIKEMARRWLELADRFEHPTQVELRGFAEAHQILGEYVEAERLLLRALEVGGKRDAQVRAQLEALRREHAASKAR